MQRVAVPLFSEITERFDAVFPNARKGQKNGTTFAVLPYTENTVAKLTKVPITVPAPIEVKYNFGHKTPFKAQVAALRMFTLFHRCFNLSDMGTGKTLATLWAYDYLRSIGEVTRMLVVAPLSTLDDVWEFEVNVNLPHLSVGVLHGTAVKRQRVLARNHDIYVVNHDGLKVVADDLMKRPDIDIIAVDELSTFRNRKAERTKVMRRVAKPRQRVWGLTATPTPNAPTDCYSQVQVVRPEALNGMSFYTLQDMTTFKVSTFVKRPKPEAAEVVRRVMSPAVRFSLEDCQDIPETVYVSRTAEMSKAQKSAYDEMMKSLCIEAADIVAANEGAKLLKLVQIGAGFAYNSDGKPYKIGCSQRLAVLDGVLSEFDGAFLLFCPFTAAAQIVQEHLSRICPVDLVIGSTPQSARKDTFDRLRQGVIRGIVAHPRTMSHGLNLTAAKTVIWFSPYPSLETFQQANRRVRRPGQRNTTRVVSITASDAERRIYQRLKNNEAVQGTLLDLIREHSDV